MGKRMPVVLHPLNRSHPRPEETSLGDSRHEETCLGRLTFAAGIRPFANSTLCPTLSPVELTPYQTAVPTATRQNRCASLGRGDANLEANLQPVLARHGRQLWDGHVDDY
jgi:hypothetical protein